MILALYWRLRFTRRIDFVNLLTGVGFMAVLVIANLTGVRSTFFYGLVGIEECGWPF